MNQSTISNTKSYHQHRASWISLFQVTILACFAYIFLEWVFFVSKPSFLSILPVSGKILVLLFSFSLFSSICCILLLIAQIIYKVIPFEIGKSLIFQLASFLPSVIAGGMILLFIDNFTYSLLKFGIVSTTGIVRGIYAVLFSGITYGMYIIIRKELEKKSVLQTEKRNERNIRVFVLILILFPITVLLVNQTATKKASRLPIPENSKALPNILLVTGDGINATHMSLYGYSRDTTPFLEDLAKTSLVAENAFTNSGHTSGSIISILTGKHPTNTRVLFPPDILRGISAYQHLPAILRSNGYFAAQFGSSYFVTSHERNMLQAFDVTNDYHSTTDLLSTIEEYLPNDLAFFIYESANRITDRVRHIFFLKVMVNPIAAVNLHTGDLEDEKKYLNLVQLLDSSEKPLFVHLHYMGTHGDRFTISNPVFSAGQEPELQGAWNVDFYDDSILRFDHYVQKITERLRDQGLYDNTILIIATDHGQQGITTERLPLMIHFPDNAFMGSINKNVQFMDIAPTILAYLGIDQPEWMEGKSLIDDELEERPILAATADQKVIEVDGRFQVNTEVVNPPFYQFGNISLVYCQNWYSVDLNSLQNYSGKVEGSTNHCTGTTPLTQGQAYDLIKHHLEEDGFDTSTLVSP